MVRQGTAFALCAVASGYMLRRWWRLDDSDRARIWKRYGLFCGLLCCGSCAGAVCFPAFAQFLVNYYASERPAFTSSVVVNGPQDFEAAFSYSRVSSCDSISDANECNCFCAACFCQTPNDMLRCRLCAGSWCMSSSIPSPSAALLPPSYWFCVATCISPGPKQSAWLIAGTRSTSSCAP